VGYWAQREAHEDTHPEGQKGGIRDAIVMEAAQWILCYGQSLFNQVLFPGDISSEELQHWTTGPLYHGKNGLDPQRWHFWRDGFNAVASSSSRGEKGEVWGEDCRSVVKKAADMMEALERDMTF
jgi:Protein of unknown function (DUF3632)